jgi:predicted nucleic acid-binding protein
VYDEISRCKNLIKPLVKAMKEKDIEILESTDLSELKNKYPELGSGELSVIAASEGKIVFIEDRKAEKAASNENVTSFNIPELLFACKKRGILKSDDIAQIISDLKEKDGYLFSKEVEEELLK